MTDKKDALLEAEFDRYEKSPGRQTRWRKDLCTSCENVRKKKAWNIVGVVFMQKFFALDPRYLPPTSPTFRASSRRTYVACIYKIRACLWQGHDNMRKAYYHANSIRICLQIQISGKSLFRVLIAHGEKYVWGAYAFCSKFHRW